MHFNKEYNMELEGQMKNTVQDFTRRCKPGAHDKGNNSHFPGKHLLTRLLKCGHKTNDPCVTARHRIPDFAWKTVTVDAEIPYRRDPIVDTVLSYRHQSHIRKISKVN